MPDRARGSSVHVRRRRIGSAVSGASTTMGRRPICPSVRRSAPHQDDPGQGPRSGQGVRSPSPFEPRPRADRALDQRCPHLVGLAEESRRQRHERHFSSIDPKRSSMPRFSGARSRNVDDASGLRGRIGGNARGRMDGDHDDAVRSPPVFTQTQSDVLVGTGFIRLLAIREVAPNEVSGEVRRAFPRWSTFSFGAARTRSLPVIRWRGQ